MLATIRNDLGVDLNSQRTALINEFNSGAKVRFFTVSPTTVTWPVETEGSTTVFIDPEYNRAFVTSQYFGYLRRDSDIGGFLLVGSG